MVKILFLIPTLGHGGAERVLVNLVNRMDKERFDITVQTLFDVGIYRGSLAPHIKYKGGHKYYFRGNSHVLKLFSPKLLYRHFVFSHSCIALHSRSENQNQSLALHLRR